MSCPRPGDLPNPGIEAGSPTLQADSLPYKPPRNIYVCIHTYINNRYHSAIKKKEMPPTTWMGLGDIMLSKISWTEKEILSVECFKK